MTTTVVYTDAADVTETKLTRTPAYRDTASGCGGAIPTQYMIKYKSVWRRVYVMSYGNGGTAYVNVMGACVVLDGDTAAKLENLGAGNR